jgi:hypothetical protein
VPISQPKPQQTDDLFLFSFLFFSFSSAGMHRSFGRLAALGGVALSGFAGSKV